MRRCCKDVFTERTSAFVSTEFSRRTEWSAKLINTAQYRKRRLLGRLWMCKLMRPLNHIEIKGGKVSVIPLNISIDICNVGYAFFECRIN